MELYATNLSTPAINSFTSDPPIDNTSYWPFQIPVEQRIFEVAVILIGIVGALGSGTVLSVFCSSKQLRKQDVNVLFINQLSLDLFACVWLLVEYPVKMANIALKGPTGYWLCMFILSEDFSFFGIFGSKVNLMNIAIERYVKIVHPIWHKNNFKSWMVYSAAVFPWLAGVFLSQSLASSSKTVIDGQCSLSPPTTNKSVKYGLLMSTITITFVLPLASFMFCYSSIIYVVRRQAKIAASQRVGNPFTDTANNKTDTRLQMNALKTMILISVAFIICWMPSDLYALLMLLCPGRILVKPSISYLTVFAGILNICMNPFIYALKYDAVKKRLVNLMCTFCDNSEPENSTSCSFTS